MNIAYKKQCAKEDIMMNKFLLALLALMTLSFGDFAKAEGDETTSAISNDDDDSNHNNESNDDSSSDDDDDDDDDDE
ncbi:hypothetical protein [Candidatus Hydrogenosomobacter endosymbioticus]|uniref:Uncharacterized protein n=1 Tax=Candidatus Hydrogenosomobacter endosymbioticus TaxID=2558174 RepID=A0ABM7V8L5_9PROT|nr:hypothetical protein [Candidatus Hydrogenosomobacter endosymbioticus]BDB96136.1 hypothetical protein HYD_2690 [Candidatus Hydrogenosomobacter endosymbioticus]